MLEKVMNFVKENRVFLAKKAITIGGAVVGVVIASVIAAMVNGVDELEETDDSQPEELPSQQEQL